MTKTPYNIKNATKRFWPGTNGTNTDYSIMGIAFKRQKHTYDTFFMIAYAKGARGSQYDCVPPSTKSGWRNKESFDHIIGRGYMEKYARMIVEAEQTKFFKTIIFSLLRLIGLYRGIVGSLPHKNRCLYNVRERIVDIADKWTKHYSLKQIARFLDVSQQQYMGWKKGFYCKFSPVLLCRKAMPNQLMFKEVELIKKAVLDPGHKNWSLVSIYYKILRENGVFFCASTFYKYVSILGLRRDKNKKPKPKNTGPRAKKPLELLHMDIAEYWVADNIKAYVHIIMDNFSRKILGMKVALDKSARLACDNLKEVYGKYNLGLNKNVMVVIINDCGPENHSVTRQFIGGVANMEQYFANRKKRGQWTNNMVEALFCKMKKFMREHEYKGYGDFVRRLEEIKTLCNDKIPIAATGGRTPNEAFYGINPFSDSLSNLLQKSHIQRVIENKTGNCF